MRFFKQEWKKRARIWTVEASVIFLLILGPGQSALAAPLYENLDHSVKTLWSTDEGHANIQPLGTGLTGTARSLVLWMQDPLNSGTAQYGPGLYACSSPAAVPSDLLSCSRPNISEHDNQTSPAQEQKIFTFLSPVTLDPTKYYYIYEDSGSDCSGYDGTSGFGVFRVYCFGGSTQYNSQTMIDPGSLTSLYFILDDANLAATSSVSTIFTVTPAASSTIATSSAATIAATGFITAGDFSNQVRIIQTYQNNAYYSSALIDVGFLIAGDVSPSVAGTYTYGVSGSGDFTISTSTPLSQIGVYTLITKITRPTFSLLGFGFGSTVIYATTTEFTVGTTTGFDRLQAQVKAEAAALASTANADGCNINFFSTSTPFSLTGCLLFLLLPDSTSMTLATTRLRDDVASRAPWGYLTRFLAIMGNQATSTLPTFTAEIALNNASDTTTLTYDPGDMLTGGAALLESIHDPYNNKSTKDVLEPIVLLVIGLGVLLTIASDLMGSHKHDAGREGKKLS